MTVTATIKGRLHSQTVSLNPHSKPFFTPYSAHFTDKETKAQRACVTGPSLHRARGNPGSREPADEKGPFSGMPFGDGMLLTWTPGWAMKCWSVASSAILFCPALKGLSKGMAESGPFDKHHFDFSVSSKMDRDQSKYW